MPRLIFACIAFCCAIGLVLLPAAARADGSVTLSKLIAFDPSVGKQEPLNSFGWPKQKQIGALIRFATSGYESRKTVEVFTILTNREGRTLQKDTIALNLAAGDHEYVLPANLGLETLFMADRINIEAEVKIAGGNRESKKIEIVVEGPALPTVSIGDLKLTDPKSGKTLTAVSPGQAFKALGTASISGNTTSLLPQFYVWGVMSNDTLRTTPFTQDQFSDTYWDVTTLGAVNGKWRFEIDCRAPQYFDDPATSSEPFVLNFAVAFTNDARKEALLGGTVTPPKSGFDVNKDLELRLLQVERNWEWKVEKLR